MALFRRFANLFRRSHVDHDIDAELQAHIALRIDANVAAGMSAEDARRDALLRFGNQTTTKERVAAADTTLSLADLGRDIRVCGAAVAAFSGICVDRDYYAGAWHRRECGCVRRDECDDSAAAECSGRRSLA